MTINEQLKQCCDDYYSTINMKKKKEIIILLKKGANEEIIFDHLKFEKFKFFVEEFGFSIEKIIQKEKYKKRILEWFMYYCNKYYTTDVNRYLTYIKFILNPSKIYSFELIYEQIKTNLKFDRFIFFIEHCMEYKQTVKNMKNNNYWNEKLIEQLNIYLEKCFFIEQFAKVLFVYGATKKGALKETIKQNHFILFKEMVERDRILLEELRQEKDWKEKIKKQLDIWVEEKSEKKELESIKFLLSCKANNEVIYNKIKESIRQHNVDVFKFFIENLKEEISLEELRQEKDWKEKLQKQLNSWLKDECKKQNLENIIFLLKYGAVINKEIIYNKIKESVEQNKFEDFKFFINNFKKEGISLEELKKGEMKDILKNKLNAWLEEKYRKPNTEDIEFLLVCNATRDEALRKSVENKQFKSFKNLLEEDRKLFEILKKERYAELQIQLNNWLEEEVKGMLHTKDNINFLLKYGANEEIIYKKIRSLIEQPIFYKFQQFIKEFEDDEECKKDKETELTIQKIIQYIKKQKKLKEQLNTWLKEVRDEKTRKLLIECGAEDISDISEDVINKSISAPYLVNDKIYPSSSITKEFDLIDKDNC